MPLKLIHGPPNSGRAGLLRGAFVAALERDPVLVVPTVDDVFAFERELCAAGAALGGSAMTFGALFHTVATAGGVPPGAELSPAQRLRTVAVAVEARRGRLGPLRRSASRPGFARAFVRLLDELQAAGLDPEAVEASAGTLEGSAYLGDIAGLFSAYAEVRERTARVDSHGIAREAIELLRRDGSFWGDRPVFLYGLDDLTPNQFELVAALAGLTEVTVALPFEEGNAALAARSRLLGELRERIGAAEEMTTEAQPGNTDSELLFHLARGFGAPGAAAAGARRRPAAAALGRGPRRGRGDRDRGLEAGRRRRRPGRHRDRPARPGAARRRGGRGAGGQRSGDGAGGGAAGRRDRRRRRPGGAAGG